MAKRHVVVEPGIDAEAFLPFASEVWTRTFTEWLLGPSTRLISNTTDSPSVTVDRRTRW